MVVGGVYGCPLLCTGNTDLIQSGATKVEGLAQHILTPVVDRCTSNCE